jgi:hypothetical protein
MKRTSFLVLLVFSFLSAGYGQQKEDTKGNTQAKVMVYFFHGTHRCTGCLNAEKATIAVLNELYRTQQEKGIIRFQSVNIEEEQNKALAERFEVAFNMLLIVPSADPARKVELTEQAFAYGTNPGELKPYIQSVIDPIIK